MRKYAIVIEKSPDGYGAYLPDIPGCAAVGDTAEEVESLLRQGLELHLQAMRDDGDSIPEPTTLVREVEVA